MIRAIEEISLNAWPSFHSLVYDGWVLRFADGYSRRANSINPLYFSSLDVDEKIRWCEDLYHEKGLPAIYKITPIIFPEDLDEKLTEHKYQKEAQTSVQVLELQSAAPRLSGKIILSEQLSDLWLDAFHGMLYLDGYPEYPHRQILEAIVPRKCFAMLTSGEEIVACGMGVLQSGFIGLYEIITHPFGRGRGFGQKLVESILAWGKENGAKKAYLQVMLDNPTAMRLYARVGFEEQYQYWYRVKRWD